ncbi:MAG: hypothetical protein MI922_15315, partial [Bacteroidales bacterium]|nr:hypothetical protein [Bacteroidales bacterium]
ISNEAFIESLVTCTGVLCGAGFETPAEALFLRKKVMVIPMKGQYEQHCNAAGANDIGVPVIQTLSMNYLADIEDWVNDDSIIDVSFPDITEDIIKMLFEDFKKSVDIN